MFDIHHELPSRFDPDWYRKQAKRLRDEYRAGKPEAVARIAEVLGARARERFLLSDAQHVIAAEHGYRNWAEFARTVQSPPPARSVGRIGSVGGMRDYERRALELIDAVGKGAPGAAARVRANVPRLATLADDELTGQELALADARLAVAREYGFPTWRELVFYVEKANREYEEELTPSVELAEAIEAIRSGEPDFLRALLAEHPSLLEQRYRGHRLLECVAQPGVFGAQLGVALGVDRRCVEVLIDAGAELEVPLILAGCFNRVELIELLLARGADLETTEIWGVTPLVCALYHGAREAAALLSSRKIVPYALWVVAASGHDELLGGFIAGDGSLLPEAGAHRPNLADVGWPPAPPRGDEPEVILAEAFVESCHNGREPSADWLLDHGADIDAGPYLGLTGLHLAVGIGYLHMVEYLVEHGANPNLRDGIRQETPLELAEKLVDRDFTSREIRDYLAARS